MSETPQHPTRPKAHSTSGSSQHKEPAVVQFETLSQGAKEVLIDHNSQIYRLRVTKNGKLILNK